MIHPGASVRQWNNGSMPFMHESKTSNCMEAFDGPSRTILRQKSVNRRSRIQPPKMLCHPKVHPNTAGGRRANIDSCILQHRTDCSTRFSQVYVLSRQIRLRATALTSPVHSEAPMRTTSALVPWLSSIASVMGLPISILRRWHLSNQTSHIVFLYGKRGSFA